MRHLRRTTNVFVMALLTVIFIFSFLCCCFESDQAAAAPADAGHEMSCHAAANPAPDDAVPSESLPCGCPQDMTLQSSPKPFSSDPLISARAWGPFDGSLSVVVGSIGSPRGPTKASLTLSSRSSPDDIPLYRLTSVLRL